MNMTDFAGKTKIYALELFVSVLVVLPFWYFYSEKVISTVALQGFSPLTWMTQLLSPENFQANFPSGVEQFSVSFFMQIYRLLYNLFEGMTPVSLMIFMELLLTLIAMRAISCQFTENRSKQLLLTFLFFSVYAFSNARSINWGRWGHPFYVGQFYVFADLARILAFFLILQKRYYLSSLFLGLSIFIHPTIGLFGAIFICSYLLFEKADLKTKIKYFSIAGSILLLNYILLRPSENNTLAPTNDWILFGKMFSVHFFPVQFGYFTYYFHLGFFQSLVFLFTVFSFSLSKLSTTLFNKRSFALGSAIILSIALSGVFVSKLELSVFLIKLALPRATEILISLGLFIVLHSLVSRNPDQLSWWQRGLSSVLIFSFFVKELNWSYLIVGLTLLALSFPEKKKLSNSGVILISFFSLLLLAYSVLGFKIPFQKFVWSPEPFIQITLAVLMFIPLLIRNYNALIAITLISGCLVFGYQNFPPLEARETSKAYEEVQRWAKKHTDKKSIFAIDPSISYGWREYSERSSFGVAREWMHTSWLYSSEQEVFKDGLSRASLFMDPYRFIEEKKIINSNLGRNYVTELTKAFYQNRADVFSKLKDQFRVEYAVIKNNRSHSIPGETVFKNNHFSVLKLN